jgi:ketosteroid isomerase-like protein
MTDEEDIVRRGRTLHAAWADSDVVTLESLLAPDYHHVDIYGASFGRDAWLSYAAQPRSPGPITTEDEVVAVMGDVGVLTSTLHLPTFDAAPVLRLTQIWVRSPRGWLRSWYHATTVLPEG